MANTQIYRVNHAMKGGVIVPKDVAVEQDDIEVNGNKFIITRISYCHVGKLVCGP